VPDKVLTKPDLTQTSGASVYQYQSPGQGQNTVKQTKDANDFSTQIAEIEISYSHKIKPSLQTKVLCSADTYKHVLPIWKNIDYYESAAVLLLSRANKVLGLHWLSTGGISGTIIDAKRVFQVVLKLQQHQ